MYRGYIHMHLAKADNIILQTDTPIFISVD